MDPWGGDRSMIRLHPLPDAYHECPYCHVTLEATGWYMPGMRTLADLRCPRCGGTFYGDLPAGHGLYYPMLVERPTGIVHNRHGVDWFARWLRESYAHRTDTPTDFAVEQFRAPREPVLLNCLDRLYGHCLLKLLNAQYYLDRRPELDLIVLIPRLLRWMVPEGVAAIWSVNLPLERGSEWNDRLASEIREQVEMLGTCRLSVALPHPYRGDFDIERFTGTPPFPIDEWRKHHRPTVTFIWRRDRSWYDRGTRTRPRGWAKLGRRLARLREADPLEWQMRKIVALAGALRTALPSVDFAIAGLGEPGGFPDWIGDLRTSEIGESVERMWCERYAGSHIVIGVHGSNMLLPSAHAGATIELVPDDRWGNLIQDILPSSGNSAECLYRYRFLPCSTPPDTVAQVAITIIEKLPTAMLAFRRPWNEHETVGDDPWLVSRMRYMYTHSGV